MRQGAAVQAEVRLVACGRCWAGTKPCRIRPQTRVRPAAHKWSLHPLCLNDFAGRTREGRSAESKLFQRLLVRLYGKVPAEEWGLPFSVNAPCCQAARRTVCAQGMRVDASWVLGAPIGDWCGIGGADDVRGVSDAAKVSGKQFGRNQPPRGVETEIRPNCRIRCSIS